MRRLVLLFRIPTYVALPLLLYVVEPFRDWAESLPNLIKMGINGLPINGIVCIGCWFLGNLGCFLFPTTGETVNRQAVNVHTTHSSKPFSYTLRSAF